MQATTVSIPRFAVIGPRRRLASAHLAASTFVLAALAILGCSSQSSAPTGSTPAAGSTRRSPARDAGRPEHPRNGDSASTPSRREQPTPPPTAEGDAPHANTDADAATEPQPPTPQAHYPEVDDPPPPCVSDTADLPLPGQPCAQEGATACTPVGQFDKSLFWTDSPTCVRPNRVVCARSSTSGKLVWTLDPCAPLAAPSRCTDDAATIPVTCYATTASAATCCPLFLQAGDFTSHGLPLCTTPGHKRCASSLRHYSDDYIDVCDTPPHFLSQYPKTYDDIGLSDLLRYAKACAQLIPQCPYWFPAIHCDACTAECDGDFDRWDMPIAQGSLRYAECVEDDDGSPHCGPPPPPTPGMNCICKYEGEPGFLRCLPGGWEKHCAEATARSAQGSP